MWKKYTVDLFVRAPSCCKKMHDQAILPTALTSHLLGCKKLNSMQPD